MAVGDVYRMNFQMLLAGRQVSSDQYYNESSPRLGTVIEVTTQLMAAVQAEFWTIFWKLQVPSEVTYVRTLGQMIYPTREVLMNNTSLAGDAGTALTEPMNGQTATLIAQYGTTWSREFQGRSYLPGIDETSANEGRIKTGSFAAIQAAVTAFYLQPFTLAGPAGGTFTPGVYSPKRHKASTPPVISNMIASTLRPRISRQVRRKTLDRTTS